MLFNVETLEAPVTRSFTDPEILTYLAAVEKVGWYFESKHARICSAKYVGYEAMSRITTLFCGRGHCPRAIQETSCLSLVQVDQPSVAPSVETSTRTSILLL